MFLGADPQVDRITQTTHRDVEHSFWHSGHDQVYETNSGVNQRQAIVTALNGDADYPSQVIKAATKTHSKPFMAYEAIAAVRAAGVASVPADLKRAIEKAIELAERCR